MTENKYDQMYKILNSDSKKADKISNKYSNKIQIIEENEKLTDEEKVKTYESLLKKVRRNIKSIDVKENIREKFSNFNTELLNDRANSEFGGKIAHALEFTLGLGLMAVSVKTGSDFDKIAGGILASMGVLPEVHNLLNHQFKERLSLIEKTDLNLQETYSQCKDTLINFDVKLEHIIENYKDKIKDENEEQGREM